MKHTFFSKSILSLLIIPFIAISCIIEDPEPEPIEQYGSLSFYAGENFCGNITVSISGYGSRVIDTFSYNVTGCDDPVTATFNDLPYGSYYWSAQCEGYSWNNSVTLGQSCYLIEIKQ